MTRDTIRGSQSKSATGSRRLSAEDSAAADGAGQRSILLEEDVDDVVERATKHWDYATRATQTN